MAFQALAVDADTIVARGEETDWSLSAGKPLFLVVNMRPLPDSIRCDKQAIALDTILWLEGDWNYTRLYLLNHSVRMSSRTLSWYERQLIDFIRVRKDAIVNPLYVQTVESISSRPRRMKIVLITGEHIEVTRRRQALVRKRFKQ